MGPPPAWGGFACHLLLSRNEDAGLNASAPPQQRWLDGWMLRLSPGRARGKRPAPAALTRALPGYLLRDAASGLRPAALYWAGEQFARKATLAGPYDVFTHPAARGQGQAGLLCERMLTG